ncbi:MAG: helix-turn-helix transcriptional regulator [Thermoleophilaceae bacterium]|nr:winged helix-turn-helix domain-containing protein [Thermoleophilaceae bacterium]
MRLLTNAAQVLACVARDPGSRLRDIATCVGITERAAHRIVCELEADGYITRHREGARNTYELHPDLPLDQESDSVVPVGALLRLLIADPRDEDRAVA